MGNPTKQQVHVNRPLTNISVAYTQQADMFAFMRMFPAVPVDKSSDSYFIFDKADSKRDDLKPRAPGTEASGSGFRIGTADYNCKRYDNKEDIPDDIRADADDPLDLDSATTLILTERGLIRQESIFATNYLSATSGWATKWTGNAAAGANQVIFWNDYTNSDPVADVAKAITTVHKATGYRPNKMCVSQDVADVLINHPDIIARVWNGQTPGQAAIVEYTDLARVFRVKEFVVSGAVYNSAEEGATYVGDFIAKKVCLLAYVAPTPSRMTPSAGYRFNWRHLAGNNEGLRIKKIRIDSLESDRIEIALSTDQKIVCADMGVLITGVIQ